MDFALPTSARGAIMNKLLLASLALIGLTGSALAADMPVKAPIIAPVAQTWTGCYIGGNVGGGWAQKRYPDFNLPPAPPSNRDQHDSGVVGGGQIGCDYQTGPWVFGIQGMFDGSDISGGHAPNKILVESTKIPWVATVTGRIGYALQPAALLYVEGGGAWVRDKHTEFVVGVVDGTADVTRSGWTVGGGLEYRFAPNWSAFVQYNYMGFGTKGVTFSLVPPPGTFVYDIRQNVQTVLFGVNYRFDGPVVARY